MRYSTIENQGSRISIVIVVICLGIVLTYINRCWSLKVAMCKRSR